VPIEVLEQTKSDHKQLSLMEMRPGATVVASPAAAGGARADLRRASALVRLFESPRFLAVLSAARAEASREHAQVGVTFAPYQVQPSR
jgi:hypothetical protein